jgi:hypothetical protein
MGEHHVVTDDPSRYPSYQGGCLQRSHRLQKGLIAGVIWTSGPPRLFNVSKLLQDCAANFSTRTSCRQVLSDQRSDAECADDGAEGREIHAVKLVRVLSAYGPGTQPASPHMRGRPSDDCARLLGLHVAPTTRVTS